jgi:ribose 5-phosphate isomerase B
VAIGCDHRGVKVKEKVKEILKEKKIEIEDVGPYSEEACDYPDFGFKVAELVGKKEVDYGILICNTGLGMTIVANKVKGVRAILCLNSDLTSLGRKHNDGNLMVLGVKYLNSEEQLRTIIDTWFSTKFEGGRHKRRVEKIINWEKGILTRNEWEMELKKWKQEVRRWQSRAWRR